MRQFAVRADQAAILARVVNKNNNLRDHQGGPGAVWSMGHVTLFTALAIAGGSAGFWPGICALAHRSKRAQCV